MPHREPKIPSSERIKTLVHQYLRNHKEDADRLGQILSYANEEAKLEMTYGTSGLAKGLKREDRQRFIEIHHGFVQVNNEAGWVTQDDVSDGVHNISSLIQFARQYRHHNLPAVALRYRDGEWSVEAEGS